MPKDKTHLTRFWTKKWAENEVSNVYYSVSFMSKKCLNKKKNCFSLIDSTMVNDT